MTQLALALRRYRSPAWLALTAVFVWYAAPVVVGPTHGEQVGVVQ